MALAPSEKHPVPEQIIIRQKARSLLDLDGCASFFQLGFDLVGFFFRSTFFNRLWCAFNKVLGFFQAKTCDAANFFNDVDFLVASSSQDNVKFALFFASSAASVTATSNSSNRNRCSSSRYAPLVFQQRCQFSRLKDGKTIWTTLRFFTHFFVFDRFWSTFDPFLF